MKRLTKLALAVVAVGVIATAGSVAWLYIEYPHVPEPAPLTVAVSPQKIARGAYIFNNVARCVDCHSARDWRKYAANVDSNV